MMASANKKMLGGSGVWPAPHTDLGNLKNMQNFITTSSYLDMIGIYPFFIILSDTQSYISINSYNCVSLNMTIKGYIPIISKYELVVMKFRMLLRIPESMCDTTMIKSAAAAAAEVAAKKTGNEKIYKMRIERKLPVLIVFLVVHN